MTSADGVQMFAAGRDDPRARRPVDGLRAVVYFILLLLACTLSVIGNDLDEQFGEFLRASPSFLETLWKVGFWGAETWVAALLVVSVVKRRFWLVGEALVAGALAVGGASLAAEIVKHD